MKILVAIDDSECSLAAVEELGARPWWGDTRFLLLHVASVPTVQQWELWGLAVDWQLREKLLAEAQLLVDDQVRLLRKLVGNNIEIDGKLVEEHGPICESIVHEASAWDADLIMIGSHGRTGFQKFLLGSVAEGVLLQAPCSVEIIKSAKKSTMSKPKQNKDTSAVAH